MQRNQDADRQRDPSRVRAPPPPSSHNESCSVSTSVARAMSPGRTSSRWLRPEGSRVRIPGWWMHRYKSCSRPRARDLPRVQPGRRLKRGQQRKLLLQPAAACGLRVKEQDDEQSALGGVRDDVKPLRHRRGYRRTRRSTIHARGRSSLVARPS